MQAGQLLPLATATAALLILAASAADAQQRVVQGGWVNPPRPGGRMHGHRGFNVPFFFGDREVVVVEREIVREVPAAPPPPPEPPPPPRKPYAIGSTYASLPGGCMKLIEDGASYYYCGGEWYRQLPGGPHAQYRAVREP
jgi:hypothetical protein